MRAGHLELPRSICIFTRELKSPDGSGERADGTVIFRVANV